MADYIEFKLHGRNCRFYSVDRIDMEFRNITGNWRPVKFSNHGIYKLINITVDYCKEIKMYLHRVIYYAHNLDWDISNTSRNNSIDHINHEAGVPLDNSITNLRVVNHQQNQFNTNAKGYSFHKKSNKYVARIRINGKPKHLGYFDLKEDARNAYLEAKKIYHIMPIRAQPPELPKPK
jgi:hypothetical protein